MTYEKEAVNISQKSTSKLLNIIKKGSLKTDNYFLSHIIFQAIFSKLPCSSWVLTDIAKSLGANCGYVLSLSS